jgi:hypothetical protein
MGGTPVDRMDEALPMTGVTEEDILYIHYKVIGAPPKRYTVKGHAAPETIVERILLFTQSATGTSLPVQRVGWMRIPESWSPTGEDIDLPEEFVLLKDEELHMPLGDFAGV